MNSSSMPPVHNTFRLSRRRFGPADMRDDRIGRAHMRENRSVSNDCTYEQILISEGNNKTTLCLDLDGFLLLPDLTCLGTHCHIR